MTRRIRFKFLRDESKLTQAEIAAKLNITQSAYSAWELGKRTPDTEGLYTLADIFSSSLDYMLGYSPNRMIDAGKPEQLLLEYLQSPYGYHPDEEQRKLIADLIDTAVEMLRSK